MSIDYSLILKEKLLKKMMVMNIKEIGNNFMLENYKSSKNKEKKLQLKLLVKKILEKESLGKKKF